MYNKIKCPFTKNFIKINSKKGKKILLNYLKLNYGGAEKLYSEGISSLTNMLEKNKLFFDNQKKIYRTPQQGDMTIEKFIQFYPGNRDEYWEKFSNPADGHCFYWALYRTLLTLNQQKKLPNYPIYNNLNHLNNLSPNYIDQIKDIGILRNAVYDLVSKNNEPFTKINIDEINMMKIGYEHANHGKGVGPDGWSSDFDITASAIISGICIAVYENNLSKWTVYYPEPDDL